MMTDFATSLAPHESSVEPSTPSLITNIESELSKMQNDHKSSTNKDQGYKSFIGTQVDVINEEDEILEEELQRINEQSEAAEGQLPGMMEKRNTQKPKVNLGSLLSQLKQHKKLQDRSQSDNAMASLDLSKELVDQSEPSPGLGNMSQAINDEIEHFNQEDQHTIVEEQKQEDEADNVDEDIF